MRRPKRKLPDCICALPECQRPFVGYPGGLNRFCSLYCMSIGRERPYHKELTVVSVHAMRMDGISARVIAEELGLVSRNAVYGIAFRKHLPKSARKIRSV